MNLVFVQIFIVVVVTSGLLKLGLYCNLRIAFLKKIRMNMIVVIAALTLPACASMGNKIDYQVETVPSKSAYISHVIVRETESGINISGEIRRQFPIRRSIPGHVDVEISELDGTLLTKNNIHYHRMSRKAVKARFSTQLQFLPAKGSSIRVLHHIGQHCKLDG